MVKEEQKIRVQLSMSSPIPAKRAHLSPMNPVTTSQRLVSRHSPAPHQGHPQENRSLKFSARQLALLAARNGKDKTPTSQPGCLLSSSPSWSWTSPSPGVTTTPEICNQNAGRSTCSKKTSSPTTVQLNTPENVGQSVTLSLPSIQAAPASNFGANSHSSNFGAYLNTTSFSDVVLEADGREFYAHKIILANRSTYFAKLFKEDSNTKSRIEYTDALIKGDTLEQVLKFIYSGQVDSFENIAGLCVAAENFSLDGLKDQCTQYLVQNLNCDGAASVLVLASANNMIELKKKCISYINRHAHDVIKTASYADLVTNHAILVDELYRGLVETFNKKLNKKSPPTEHLIDLFEEYA